MKLPASTISRNMLAGLLGVTLTATAVLGAAHLDKKGLEDAVKARQSHMQLYAFNLGLLGGMAKGEIEYDASAAEGAAANLAALAALDQGRYWPEGTETGAMETRALPEIWSKMEEFDTATDGLIQATMTLEEAAGTDLESLQAGLGDVGKACGACHKPFRKPED